MKQKKGAMEISFGMIFSIILIIIFIAFAIYGISKFLNLQKTIQAKKFIDDLNFDIDKLWKANSGSQPVSYSLQAEAKKVCFNENKPGEIAVEIIRDNSILDSGRLIHAGLSDDFSKGNGGNCALVKDRKITLQLEKKYGEALVEINKM